jgi:ATP-dependent Clp protease ATP-binding subunit ClpA
MALRWFKSRGERPTGPARPRVDLVALDREFGIGLDERARVALTAAGEEAVRSKQTEIGAEHLIAGVVAEGGAGAELLAKQGLTLDDIRLQVSEALATDDPGGQELGLTAEAHAILQVAAEAAGIRGRRTMAPEHILYGIACAGFESTSRMLQALGIDRQALLKDVEPLLS